MAERREAQQQHGLTSHVYVPILREIVRRKYIRRAVDFLITAAAEAASEDTGLRFLDRDPEVDLSAHRSAVGARGPYNRRLTPGSEPSVREACSHAYVWRTEWTPWPRPHDVLRAEAGEAGHRAACPPRLGDQLAVDGVPDHHRVEE